MSTLQDTRVKYPAQWQDWSEAEQKLIWMPMPVEHLVPDVVLDAIREVAPQSVPAIFEKHLALQAAGLVPDMNQRHLNIPEPRLSWERTCALVIAAYTRFDPALGQKVADALAEIPSRIEGKPADEKNPAGGHCAPPGYREHTRAKIYYRHDGTINDAVYLAHELGHLLSNDFAQERGYDGKDTQMSKGVSEVPGMAGQFMLYDYLMNGQGDAGLKTAARQHFIGEITRNLYDEQASFAMAGLSGENFSMGTYTQRVEGYLGRQWREFAMARDHRRHAGLLHSHNTASIITAGLYNSGALKNPAVFDAVFRRGKDTALLDVLEKAGVSDEAQLKGFISKAIVAAAKPVEQLYAGNLGSSAAPAMDRTIR